MRAIAEFSAGSATMSTAATDQNALGPRTCVMVDDLTQGHRLNAPVAPAIRRRRHSTVPPRPLMGPSPTAHAHFEPGIFSRRF